jgi:ATP-dependent RNA helicase DHX36
MHLLKSSAASVPVECEASDVDEKLLDEFLEKSMSEEYVDMLETRQKLPAYQKKQEIIDLIEKNQLILVEGNTGCGKTTQVAQYILDDALMNKKGSTTRILCTQPRRIAG